MIHVREWIEFTAQAVEVLAVAIMVCFIISGTFGWLIHSAKKNESAYERYRVVLGKALLIGLELLVAADIINTVVFALTLQNLALLAGLVVVRTTLGWTVTVEVEGRWPWQAASESRKASEKQPAHILDPPADTSIKTGGRSYEPFGRNAER